MLKKVFLSGIGSFFLFFGLFSLDAQAYVRAIYPGGNTHPRDEFTGLEKLYLSREQPPLYFRKDMLSGPTIVVDNEHLKLKAEEINPYRFYANHENVRYSLFLRPNVASHSYVIEIEIMKMSHKAIEAQEVSFLLGLDMGNSLNLPQGEIYTPTILKKEENTFWGSFSTQDNKAFVITCSSPIESISYLQSEEKNQTIQFNLQSKSSSLPLQYKESKKWVFSLSAVMKDENLKDKIYSISKIPTVHFDRSFFFKGETVEGHIHTKETVSLQLLHPNGHKETIKLSPVQKKDEKPSLIIPFQFKGLKNEGIYYLTVENESGLKTSGGFTFIDDVYKLIKDEVQTALKNPLPTSSKEVCYADLIVLLAPHFSPQYEEVAQKRYKAIKGIFLQPQVNRLNFNAIQTPASALFLLNLSLMQNDLELINLTSQYFLNLQLPNGSLFFPKTKTDITNSSVVLTNLIKAASFNKEKRNLDFYKKLEKAIIKAFFHIKNHKNFQNILSSPEAAYTSFLFIEFSQSNLNISQKDRDEFFQLGLKLLRGLESDLQEDNCSPYSHGTYNTSNFKGVLFPVDPTSIFIHSALHLYTITLQERILFNGLNGLISLFNRSRELSHDVAHILEEDQHCRFQASMLLIEHLLHKAYLFVESPKVARGIHCHVVNCDNGTLTLRVDDLSVRKIHVRTLEPVRLIINTPKGVINRVVKESGWIDLF